MINTDLTADVEAIETVLGYSIQCPNFGRPPVASIGKYFINPDFVRHAYVPHRLRQLGLAGGDILEIGGGFGCLERFCSLVGCRSYTIIDLPYVNAIQMAFIGATLGEGAVCGFGESEAKIRILPATRKMTAFDRSFDVAVNMDSLPEINLGEAQDYLRLIKSNAKRFLSVNQEARNVHKGTFKQHFVPELVASIGGFSLLSRHPYWIQQGYVEELYGMT